MRTTPRGLRLHIGIFGRRNAGKSSLLNALTRQDVSIVSEHAGTTTDPVEKPMELLPLGPVVFIDTAGIDDAGALGQQRVERTRRILDRCDVGLIVAAAGRWDAFEEQLHEELRAREVPIVAVFNQADLGGPAPELLERLERSRTPHVCTVASAGEGVLELREALLRTAPADFINAPSLIGDLVRPGDLAVLVVPIDLEAPKGRLILPQVQTIRDLLDHDAHCMVVKERELRAALARLSGRPTIVVTDSQAFVKVVSDIPANVPLTSFSILFARAKGDLLMFTRGALAIDALKPGSRVLIAEACTHHPIGDDIGRVKIPRWLAQHVGAELEIAHVQGHDFPNDLSTYELVVQCGSCVQNRREVLNRIAHCQREGVPITNYGMAIAFSLGIFERALAPFPAALEWYRAHRRAPDDLKRQRGPQSVQSVPRSHSEKSDPSPPSSHSPSA